MSTLILWRLPTVKKQCAKCGQWVADSKLSTHVKTCAGNWGAAAPTEDDVASQAPSAFATKVKLSFPAFKPFLKDSVAKRIFKQYLSKVRKLVDYFEQTVNRFTVDSLMFPAVSGCPLLPSLSVYLDPAFLDSDKKMTILAYTYIGNFLIYNFELKYGSSNLIGLPEKTFWKQDVLQKIAQNRLDLKKYYHKIRFWFV